MRGELVARLFGSADRLPRPVWLVLRGLTDPRWWIAHAHGLVKELVDRLGPYAHVLTAGMGRRRALCIGVGRFEGASEEADEEPDLTAWPALPYAERCTWELQRALATAGYPVSVVTDADRLTASELGGRVGVLLADDGVDVAVVHVLSHGERRPRGGVYVVGSDGRWSARTRVEDWVVHVSDDPSAPHTLFLLDLCHAGAATRLQWQPPEAGAQERAWVIAAAGAADPAYSGRLTRAAAAVIRRIAAGDIDFSPNLPAVPFATLFDLIAKELRTLALREGGYQQEPTGTPTVGTAHVPFFPNPHFQADSVHEATAALESAAAPFVDPVLDAQHFRDRATGHGLVAGTVTVGCFAGRAPQLHRLAAWLDGTSDGPGLVVVTGSPGAGKSALLGVLVCAAHPVLREPTQPVWRHIAAHPSLNQNLVAVHARQQTIDEIRRSVATQLGISDDEVSPDLLVMTIVERDAPPVIVLDAIDEAIHPRQLVEQLVEPLVRARRADGTAACRLLLGMRPWPEFIPLLDVARRGSGLIDLDDIPMTQRRQDVADYVTSLLELQPDYADTAQRAGLMAFADAVAATLVRPPDADDRRWGEFLVAALYTHWTARDARPSLADPLVAAALGADVPTTLPAVLELDLAARSDLLWLKPVLHTIAHGFGAGMPLTTIQAVAPVFAGKTPTRQEITAALDASRFYLQTSTDTDGTTLYRLFHHGLTNALTSAAHADRILDHLLGAVPAPAGDRRWDLAEPYILRHAIQHAACAGRVHELLADTEFLIHAEPVTISAALHEVHGDATQAAAAIYVTSTGRLQHLPPAGRRDILAVNATRFHATALAHEFAHRAGHPAMAWRPVWATGSNVSPALRATFIGNTANIHAVACAEVGGRQIAVTGGVDGKLRIWDFATRQQLGVSLAGHSWITAIVCAQLGGRPIAVTGAKDGELRVWDLTKHQQIGNPITDNDDEVLTLECVQVDGRLTVLAVTVARVGMWGKHAVRMWDLATGTRIHNSLTDATDVRLVSCTDLHHRPIAVTCGGGLHLDDGPHIWDLTTGQRIGTLPRTKADALSALACVEVDGRPTTVAGRADGALVTWDLTTHERGTAITGQTGLITSVTCVQDHGRPIAITTGNRGDMWVWDLHQRRRTGGPITGHVDRLQAVACASLDDRLVAVTTSADVVDAGEEGDGVMRIWDLDEARQIGNPQFGHAGEVRAVVATDDGGHPAVISAAWDDTVRVWDLTDGKLIDTLQVPGMRGSGCVAYGRLHGQPVIVATAVDLEDNQSAIQVWDLATKELISCYQLTELVAFNNLACIEVNGHLAVTASDEHHVVVWHLTGKHARVHELTGHTDYVETVTCTSVDGRPLVISAGGNDCTVRMWDIDTGQPVGDPLTGHRGWLSSVACTELAGTPVVVTSGSDATIQVWDLRTRKRISKALIADVEGIDGLACTTLDGRPIAVGRSWRDASVVVWDLLAEEQLATIRLPAPVQAVTALHDMIIAGYGWDVIALRHTPDWPR